MTHDVDATLILEGTYPYVSGGVSTWVHQLLHAYPERRFSLLHIAPYPGAYKKRVFDIPDNVETLAEVACRGGGGGGASRRRAPTNAPALRRPRRSKPSRVLNGIRRLHVEDAVDDQLVDDLAQDDLSVSDLLYGEESFELLSTEIYPQICPNAPFMDFFWHFRGMHIPLLRMLAVRCPSASMYHAVSAGFAGLVGAIASRRTGRPLVVTEHGIYAREREIELARASWIKDEENNYAPVPSPLRRFWYHYFQMLSRIAYHQATRLVTLSETNRARQLADGADPQKTWIIPNGVDSERFRLKPENDDWNSADGCSAPCSRMRVGFVGRVVPIKDVITLVRACKLATEKVDIEVWVVGPEDEDPEYAARCHKLVDLFGLTDRIKFLGRQPVVDIYPQLDVLLLTSISEGQPLVILEAHAAGLPAIATDVGACRELLEGTVPADYRIGPSGIVTRVANAVDTAAALVHLARNPEVRRQMGKNGLERVTARYQQHQVVANYDSLYSHLVQS